MLITYFPEHPGYEELSSGEVCPSGKEITSEEECRKAAKMLEMQFAHSWNGPRDFPGCLIAHDGREKVFFNTSPSPNNTANNLQYGAICKRSAGQ